MRATDTVILDSVDWTPLQTTGIDLESLDDVETLADGTLAFKGHRVLVYIRDQYLDMHGKPTVYKYHVAECSTLQKMRRDNRFARCVATTRCDGRFVVNHFERGCCEPVHREQEAEMHVCCNCLTALDWSGYATRVSDRARRGSIVASFSAKAFLETFTSQVASVPSHTDHTAPLNVYAENWSDISFRYRKSVGFKCEKCERSFSASPEHLHTHHRNGNKADNTRGNLEALCESCHARQPGHGHMGRPVLA